MVYVLNKNGKPLMPTKRYGKVKHLLKSGLAKVVKREPFTIQLLYEGTEYVQVVTLGVDAGSKVVGLSATTEKEELYVSEATLRNDIVGLLSERRQTGGDSPGNLITLCETCHKLYHAGKIILNIKRLPSYRDGAFMGIMRWRFYQELKESYPNVSLTYGYITKNSRIENNIEKTHAADAYCIAGNLNAKRLTDVYLQKFVRHSNRSLYKANLLKGGIRKANKAPTLVHGYKLFDKVHFSGQDCFIFGRRATGYFDLRLLDGTVIHRSTSHKKLKLLSASSTVLIERREQGA